MLGLTNTHVTDLKPLAALTAISDLFFDGSRIADLRPLKTMRRLADPLTFTNDLDGDSGLTFTNTAATRAITLFDYLETWVPPDASPLVSGSVTIADEPTAPAPTPRQVFLPALTKLTTTQLTQVLKDSYPDLRARSHHLVALIRQEQAAFALIPIPNDDDRLAEYRRK